MWPTRRGEAGRHQSANQGANSQRRLTKSVRLHVGHIDDMYPIHLNNAGHLVMQVMGQSGGAESSRMELPAADGVVVHRVPGVLNQMDLTSIRAKV